MTDRETLIEEAAKAIRDVRWNHALPHSSRGGVNWKDTDLARAALAVFEKAQGEPSDAQVSAFFDRFNQRRDETWWEASIDKITDFLLEAISVSGMRLVPISAERQGEPSDAQVDEIIARALAESDERNHEALCACGSWPEECVTYGHRKPWSHDAEFVARAALRAALDKGVLS